MTTPFRNISVLLTANNTQLKSSLTQSAAAVNAFDGTVKKANTSLASSGKLMAGALAGGAAAAAAGLVYAASKAIEFEKAMRNVNSISGLSEQGLASLSEQVIQMSTTLPQSATELAEGLYDIASSGFQGAEGIQVLDAAAKSASAGMSTTATAAKAITAVLNSYGLGAESASDVSDVLFQTVNAGVLSFEELAGSIGDVTGIAATAGVKVDELGAAYAAMTLQGVSGSESATLLTNIFSKMLKPSEALAGLMKELGYESGEAMLKANGLKGSMDLLREATGGSATAIFEIFPDIQAARGALALMAEDGAIAAQTWDKIADAENRAGATQKTLNEQMKSVSAQMKLARNQLDAFATTAGLKVLPVIIDLLDGARVLGSELKDNLGDIVNALGPTWDNLGEVLADVWEMLVQVGEAVGPLARGLATLAVGSVIITLNALTEVLSILTGVIADNEGAATLLAVALGITLLGGVAGVTTKIQVGLVVALYNLLQGLVLATGAASKFNLQMLKNIASTGGAAALIAGALVAWQGYKDGVSQAQDALERFQQSQSSDDLATQIKGVGALTNEYLELENRLAELDNRGLLSDLFNVKAAGEELGIRRNIREVYDESVKAERQLGEFTTSVNRLAESGFEPGSAAANKFHNEVVLTGKAFDDMLPTLQKAGVQVGDSYTTMQAKVEAFKASQEVGKGATKSVVESLGDLSSGAKDAETALDELKSSLDRLMGVFITADEATIGFEAALDELAEITKGSTASLDANTEAGRNNRQAINDSVSSLRDQIEASARAGEGSDVLAEKLRTGRERIIESARAAGLNAGEVEKMLTQYNLTPELVQTIIKAVGVEPTKEQLAAIQQQLNAVDNKVATPEIRLLGMGQFEQNAINAEKRLARLSRVSVTAQVDRPAGDGPGRGGAVLSKVSQLMEGLPGIRVSSTYRSPSQNAAAGGSPNSYHLDRGNPAVDVAGPTSSLDRLHSRAVAAGGWRELLWRVPNHYDHVHFAAAGGPIKGPGTGTSDSIPAWLSNNEHVWTAREVHNAGGHAAVESIRSQYRFADGGAPGFTRRGERPSSLGMGRSELQALIRAMRESAPVVGSLTVQHNSERASAAQIVDEVFHQGALQRMGGRR